MTNMYDGMTPRELNEYISRYWGMVADSSTLTFHLSKRRQPVRTRRRRRYERWGCAWTLMIPRRTYRKRRV